MNSKHQKTQLLLAFPEEGRGEAPSPRGGGSELAMAERTTENPASTDTSARRSTSRTAVYVTRMHGGVGGGNREVSPYPDRARSAPVAQPRAGGARRVDSWGNGAEASYRLAPLTRRRLLSRRSPRRTS